MLSSIFRITLDSSQQQDSQGHHLRYLESSRQDIEETSEEVRLSTGVLDQTLVEAASNLPKNTTPLDYFLACWKRISRQFKALRKASEQDYKFRVTREARRLTMSYCAFAITMPEMFG